MPQCIVFKSEELLPQAWTHFLASGPVRVFNPGLLRDGGGWLFAYRVVASDGLRRIAICRLDRALRPIVGSAAPLTDFVRFDSKQNYPEQAKSWFADPRLYRLGGQLFVYWNSGWHEPHNCQFLQQLDAATLRPLGSPRELLLRGERQPLEKNWMLFGDGPFYAVYSASPHRVLSFSPAGDGPIEFVDFATTAVEDFKLRGGAPPQLVHGKFWSFCHIIENAPDGYRYSARVYRFAATPPFAPTDAPASELSLANPFGGQREHAKLNPAVGEVNYPCGAAFDGERWLVSFGINDERCAIALLSPDEVAGALRPIAAAR